MTNQSVTCPYCGGPIIPSSVQSSIHCKYCGNLLDLHRSLCPDCGQINPEGQRYCQTCGSAITRTCPACQKENWAGNEKCTSCGRTLDLLEIMTRSRVRDTRARIQAQQQQALQIKQTESLQAEARMSHFWEIERQRLEEIDHRNAQQRIIKRRVIAIILFAAALCVLFTILTLVVKVWGS